MADGSNEAAIAVAHEHAETQIAAKIEGILELVQGWVRIVLESRTEAVDERWVASDSMDRRIVVRDEDVE